MERKAEQPREARLIFVYNADSGLFNSLADIAHKVLSPNTYTCNLCAITHGYFRERRQWRNFLKTIENPLEFLHRDEFRKKYGRRYSELLPAVFRLDDQGLTRVISCDEIAECKKVADLEKLIQHVATWS